MIKNIITLHNGYVEIEVYGKKNDYRGKILLDILDLELVGKIRISNTGYAYQCKEGGKSVANVIMGHEANRKTVVDHINSNRSDNRRCNLRVISQQENTQARKSFSRNNTGQMGVSYRTNGKYEYYRVSLTDPVSKNRITKQFNINKMGKERAFLEAKKYLQEMKENLSYCV